LEWNVLEVRVLEDEWIGLEKRWRLARARREREKERRVVLNKLIRKERYVAQLRAWIAAYKIRVASKATPDLDRMLAWAQAQLVEFEIANDPGRLVEVLRAGKLFPEVDELQDPLGEPPAERLWA
jgi:hypothetical protein